jgi:hypothetical protein
MWYLSKFARATVGVEVARRVVESLRRGDFQTPFSVFRGRYDAAARVNIVFHGGAISPVTTP